MKFFLNRVAVVLFLSSLILSCKKTWLEAKPDINLQIPTTLADYLAILDKTGGNGVQFNNEQNGWGEVAAGDFWIIKDNIDGRPKWEGEIYKWQKDRFYSDLTITFNNWRNPYERIFYTNIVLEGIENIQPVDNGEELDWKQAKGGALFLRAYNHYDIAQLFCKPYTESTAASDLGIPLRLQSDFNIPSHRSSVKETYLQIIKDLKDAVDLLPIETPVSRVYQCRPTKAAANAMLSRVYLSMEDYENALIYAEKTLQQYNYLMDYNNKAEVDSAGMISSFYQFNKEVIFQNLLNNLGFNSLNKVIVDSTLYKSYNNSDRRKVLFFRVAPPSAGAPPNSFIFKGSYDGPTGLRFSGLATNELYLIKAECYARKADTSNALKALNDLLVKRWRTGTFVRYTAIDANDALKKIIDERRKELFFRGLRWTDLRRLNKDPQFAVTLTRNIKGEIHTLPPNDPRYIFPIPYDIIELSGLQQNPR